MAANFTDIEKALIAGVRAVDDIIPKGYPNKELTPLPENGEWIQIHNRRGNTIPITLGTSGEDENTGFMQIDINYPQNQGSFFVMDTADRFAAYFTAGRELQYNNQTVKVQSSSLSAGRYVGGYYRVSLTVNYYARTTRN